MKAYKLALMSLAFAGIMVSCSDDDNYLPGAQSAGAFFPTTNPSTIKVEDGDSEFTVTVARTDKSGEATYELTTTYPENATYTEIFSIPDQVTFAAGEASKELTVTFDPADIEYNEPYEMTLSVPEAESSLYGQYQYTFTVIKELTWSPMGEALYTTDFLSTFFNVGNPTYKVPIEVCDQQPGKYRLVNPYGALYPLNEPGDYDTTTDHYMVYNAVNPDQVYLEYFESGMAWSYGEFIMYSYAGYLLANGKTPEEVAAAGVFGTLKDGVITFPTKSLLIAMADYKDGALYFANTSGAFRLVLPGYYVDKDYETSVAFKGLFTDAESGDNYAVLNIAVGTDASEAKAAVVKADAVNDIEDLYQAIIDGTADTQAFAPGFNGQAQFAVSGAGNYLAAIVTFDGADAVSKSSTGFEIVGGGSTDEGNWTSLGMGSMVDGWVIPFFSYNDGTSLNPFDFEFYVEIQENADEAGIYRLVSPYTSEYYPLVDYNDNKKKANILINATDPDYVYMEVQFSGMSLSGFGDIYFSEGSYVLPLYDWTQEQVIAQGVNSTFNGSQIEMPLPFFFDVDGGGPYSWGTDEAPFDVYPSMVYFPEEQTRMPRIARAAKSNAVMSRVRNHAIMKDFRKMGIRTNLKKAQKADITLK